MRMHDAAVKLGIASCLLLLPLASWAEPVVPGHTVEVYASVDTPDRLSFDPTGVLYVGNQNFPSQLDASIYRVGIGGSPVELYGPPRSDPDAVLFDVVGAISDTPGSVLIGGDHDFGGGQGLITAIRPDQTSELVLGPTPVFTNPVDMAFDSAGRLVFTDASGPVFVSAGGFPTELFGSAAWSSVAIDAADNIYTTDQNGLRVQVHDLNGALVNEELAVSGSLLSAMEFAGNTLTWGDDLYALAQQIGELVKIDALGTITTIGSGFGQPNDLTFGPDDALYVSDYVDGVIYRIVPSSAPLAYIVNSGDRTVSVIDTGSDTVVETILGVEPSPFGVAVHPTGATVYVTHIGSSTVSVIDAVTRTITDTVIVGTGPTSAVVLPDGTKLYVANQFSDTVSVIDTSTNMVVSTVAVGDTPLGTAVHPDGTRVYVANRFSPTVSVIDTATDVLTDTIVGVGSDNRGLEVHPDGTRLYVPNFSSQRVSIIDTATNETTDTVTVGTAPISLAIHPDGSAVYVVNLGSNTVSVVDTATSAVTDTVVVGSQPGTISVHPDGTRVYVTNAASDNLSIIDTATNTVANTVALGDAPVAAYNRFIGPAPGTTNHPPEISCNDLLVGNDAGQCDAAIDCESIAFCFDPDEDLVTQSCDPEGTYAVGGTDVTVQCTAGEVTVTTVCSLTVEDVEPPEIIVELTPSSLWPPNHRMLTIESSVSAGDNCDTPTVVLASVTSNESDNGEGDGNTVDDIQDIEPGTPDFVFRLRAERAGGGNGRIYSAVYTATDASANTASSAGFVLVPHDQSGVTDPISLLLEQTTDGTLASWCEASGALTYDVIRGGLSNIVETGSVIGLGTVTCIEENSADLNTAGLEDPAVPRPGETYFYLVQYDDGTSSSYGTESSDKPRAAGPGGCR